MKNDVHEARGLLWMGDVGRDLAHAARALSKARTFAFVCIVSLGIGMAPVIAIPFLARIFELPPPGVDTDGLVSFITTPEGPRQPSAEWSWPDFVDLGDADTGVQIFGWAPGQSEVTLPGAEGAKTLSPTMFVSANYFRTLGVSLGEGPGFGDGANGGSNAGPVVILSYGFWQNRLGSDPEVVGSALTLGGVPHVVVGVAPETFQGHFAFQGRELFVPLERHPLLVADGSVRFDRGTDWVRIHGRLSPETSVDEASAAVSVVTSQLAAQYPTTNEFKAGIVREYDPVGSLERAELTVIEAVGLTLTGLVLLVVCLNLSGMMQVRTAIRERELSIRRAIGASRGRLIRYLLSEAVILAGLGGTLSSLVLFNIPPAVGWLADGGLPPQMREALRPDLSMVAISLGLCLATSLVFGLLPAVRFSRPAIITALKDDAGAGGGLRVGRVHRVTAALQVMIAVPLLVLGFMSLDRVRTTATADLGFDADVLSAARLNLGMLTDEDAGFRIRSLQDSLRAANGVASVTVADGLPLDFRYRISAVSLDARDPRVAPRLHSVQVTRAGEDYLTTMGIPLLLGRGFTPDDVTGTEPVTLVSKTLAEELFPNSAGDAVGQRLRLGTEERTRQTLTIVGVTGDFPTSQMSTQRAQLLLPLAQHFGVRWDDVVDDQGGEPNVMLIARSAAGEPPLGMTAALENVVRELDEEFTSEGIVTGVALRQNSMRDFLTQSAVAGASGGVVLVLAALGVYGVVGLMVATRTREIAVRIALGASHRRVLGMILFGVVKLAAPGVAAGLVITALLIRVNGVDMGIPLSYVETLAYVAGAAVAILVAVLASFGPARRAASVPPMVAMRAE